MVNTRSSAGKKTDSQKTTSESSAKASPEGSPDSSSSSDSLIPNSSCEGSSPIRRSGRCSVQQPVVYYPKRQLKLRSTQDFPTTGSEKSSEGSTAATPTTASTHSNVEPDTPEGSSDKEDKPVTPTSPSPLATASGKTTTEYQNPLVPPSPLPSKFAPWQISALLRANATSCSRLTSAKPLDPCVLAELSTRKVDLRTLAREAATHYSYLPKVYGDLEGCLPHLYKTFLATAEYERFEEESGGVVGERDIHVVLMKVFEIVFPETFGVGAAEVIWELLGFEKSSSDEEGKEGGGQVGGDPSGAVEEESAKKYEVGESIVEDAMQCDS